MTLLVGAAVWAAELGQWDVDVSRQWDSGCGQEQAAGASGSLLGAGVGARAGECSGTMQGCSAVLPCSSSIPLRALFHPSTHPPTCPASHLSVHPSVHPSLHPPSPMGTATSIPTHEIPAPTRICLHAHLLTLPAAHPRVRTQHRAHMGAHPATGAHMGAHTRAHEVPRVSGDEQVGRHRAIALGVLVLTTLEG